MDLSMFSIWKYVLKVTDYQTIMMAQNAHILSVQEQYGNIVLWAESDTKAQPENRSFHVVATGQEHKEHPGKYIGTVQVGSLVWHIYEAIQ